MLLVLPASAAGVLETGAFADTPTFVVPGQGVPSMAEHCVAEIQSKESLKLAPGRDPLYLFACYLEWRNKGNLRAFRSCWRVWTTRMKTRGRAALAQLIRENCTGTPEEIEIAVSEGMAEFERFSDGKMSVTLVRDFIAMKAEQQRTMEGQ